MPNAGSQNSSGLDESGLLVWLQTMFSTKNWQSKSNTDRNFLLGQWRAFIRLELLKRPSTRSLSCL